MDRLQARVVGSGGSVQVLAAVVGPFVHVATSLGLVAGISSQAAVATFRTCFTGQSRIVTNARIVANAFLVTTTVVRALVDLSQVAMSLSMVMGGWEVVVVVLGVVLPRSHVHQVLMLLAVRVHVFTQLPLDVFRQAMDVGEHGVEHGHLFAEKITFLSQAVIVHDEFLERRRAKLYTGSQKIRPFTLLHKFNTVLYLSKEIDLYEKH